MRLILFLLFFLSSCSTSHKKFADHYVELDGDYLTGCIHAMAISTYALTEEWPPVENLEALCMDIYLSWLNKDDKKDKNNE